MLAFLVQSMRIHHFSGSCVEIIFRLLLTENKIKWKTNENTLDFSIKTTANKEKTLKHCK